MDYSQSAHAASHEVSTTTR